MPDDKNGTPLAVGDRVTMEFDVQSIGEGESGCNVTLAAIDSPAAEDEYLPSVTCNSKLVTKSAVAAVALLLLLLTTDSAEAACCRSARASVRRWQPLRNLASSVRARRDRSVTYPTSHARYSTQCFGPSCAPSFQRTNTVVPADQKPTLPPAPNWPEVLPPSP